jgi:glycosyltransferase involved in cell wall biosynthesis
LKDKKRIIYFPFNVDLALFKRKESQRLDQMIYIGNFGSQQNLSSLIKAMPRITEEFPKFKLRFYGGGDDETHLKELVKNHGLEKICLFHDPIDRNEVPKTLSESTIGIVALSMDESLYYAMPTKTFEYFACSLPVFAYGNSQELERVVIDSNAGIFVKTDEPGIIAEKIIKMIREKEALVKYAKNGREFVEKNSESISLESLI